MEKSVDSLFVLIPCGQNLVLIVRFASIRHQKAFPMLHPHEEQSTRIDVLRGLPVGAEIVEQLFEELDDLRHDHPDLEGIDSDLVVHWFLKSFKKRPIPGGKRGAFNWVLEIPGSSYDSLDETVAELMGEHPKGLPEIGDL